MTEKKYRLKKDLPDAKAGDVYVKEKNSDRYRNEYTLTQKEPVIEHNSYFTWQVENNPDFFELIPDPKEETKEQSFTLNQVIDFITNVPGLKYMTTPENIKNAFDRTYDKAIDHAIDVVQMVGKKTFYHYPPKELAAIIIEQLKKLKK